MRNELYTLVANLSWIRSMHGNLHACLVRQMQRFPIAFRTKLKPRRMHNTQHTQHTQHTHTHTRARTPSIFGWTWQSFDSKAWDPLLAQGFQIPGKRHFIKIMVTIMWWWGWWLWGRLTVIQDGMLLAKGHACAMTSHPRLLHACALCPSIITILYYLPLHIIFCYFAFESF